MEKGGRVLNFFTSLLLVFAIALNASAAPDFSLSPDGPTLEDLKKRYPNARFKVVSREELEVYRAALAGGGAAAAVDDCGDEISGVSPEGASAAASSADPENWRFWSNLGGGGSGDGKEFLVVVALIGVVVVAALAVYAAGYLLRAASFGLHCRSRDELGLRFSYLTDNTDTQVRHGTLSGLYYSLGYKLPIGTFGLTFEGGHFDMDLREKTANETRKFDGPYLLAGPNFNIPFGAAGSTAFVVELLAGTTTDEDIGVMSTLRLGLDFRLSPEVRWTITLGAAVVKVKTFKGVLTDLDQLNYLSGASLAWRF